LIGGPQLVIVTFIYTLLIAFLMVSQLPVLSGKKLGTRVSPELVLPVFVVVVLFVALLVSYPWEVLTIGTIAYLAALPLGWASHRRYERADAAARASAEHPASAQSSSTGEHSVGTAGLTHNARDERPSRLN
jgi:CDP-diacylglycerol--serine O-phosphatidyltransferase